MNLSLRGSLGMLSRADKFAVLAIISIVFGVLLVGFGASTWVSNRDRLRPSVDIKSTQTLELVGTPGKDVGFYLTIQDSLGHWDSDGIKIVLGEHSSKVISEHRDDWGKAVSQLSNSSEPMKIFGQFKVPENFEIGQIKTGKIIGSISYPGPSGGGEFSNRTVSTQIPVSLKIVNTDDMESYISQRQGVLAKLYPIVLGIAGALLAVGISSIFSYVMLNNRLKKGRPINDKLIQVWYLFIGILAILVGLLVFWWFLNNQKLGPGQADALAMASQSEIQEAGQQTQQSADTTPEFKEYTYLNEGGYSLQYPYAWYNALTCPRQKETLHLGPTEESVAVCGRENLSLVMVSVHPVGTTANWELVDTCVDAKDNWYRAKTECKNVLIDNYDWLRLTYEGKKNDDSPTWWEGARFISYQTTKDDKFYLIQYTKISTYPDEESAFEQIVQSFTFKD